MSPIKRLGNILRIDPNQTLEKAVKAHLELRFDVDSDVVVSRHCLFQV